VEITEVRIKLMEDNNERLLAFCSVTFDDAFVVRDLKIIEGAKGSFVAMPSRKLTDRCPHCGYKNHLRARFCNQCGTKLDEDRATRDADGRAKLHADIAHPINSGCREVIQGAVLHAYKEEKERAKQPGYVCTYDDFDGGDYEDTLPHVVGELALPRRSGDTCRSHAAHGPRGAHNGRHASTHESAMSVRQEKPSEGFGAGIL
jgi:stage V sporulation protein G